MTRSDEEGDELFLSASEAFLLGRIIATHEIELEQAAEDAPQPQVQLVVQRVFSEFGLALVGPPPANTSWTDDVPGDVAWKRTASTTPCPDLAERIPAMLDTLGAGLPSLDAGVSVREERLYVRRQDGRVAAWSLAPPRSGLFMHVMRRLYPDAGVSPYLWLMMQDGPWARVVEKWKELPDPFVSWPHVPFEPDAAVDLAARLRHAAEAAGCGEAYRLGNASGVVDARLRHVIAFATQADARLRHDVVDDHPPPAEDLQDAMGYAIAMLRSGEAREVAAADGVAAEMYEAILKALTFSEAFCPRPNYLLSSLQRAERDAERVSSYLYGTCRGRLP